MKRQRLGFSPERHQRQTQARLVAGGMAILICLGGGLVWLLYGFSAAVMAVGCLTAVIGVIAVLWFILTLLERWVREEDP